MNVNAEAIKARQARDKAALEFSDARSKLNNATGDFQRLTAPNNPPGNPDLAKIATEYAEALLACNKAKAAYLATRSKRAPRAPKT